MMAARSGHGGRNSAGGGQGVPFADWVGASWRERSDGRMAGQWPPSGWEWQGSQSSQGATELVFPGPALGQMQSEATGRAGEPSGEGEEASSEGLGGYQLLTQTDARGPACHHLHRQPGGVGGEATRGEMVQSDAVLEVSNGVLDLGVAPMVGLQFQGFPLSGR